MIPKAPFTGVQRHLLFSQVLVFNVVFQILER